MILLIIGKILQILFTLLNCSKVGNYTVHFYFGYEKCYKITWFLSFISLILIIFTFIWFFIKLRKTNIIQRQNKDYILNQFISKYKPQFYYWEFIIFIRRIIIAMFAISVDDINAKFIFIAIMIFSIYLLYISTIYNSWI